MKILERILLATDFLKSSKNVIDNAIALARTFHSKMSILHVLPDDISSEKAKKLLEHAAQKHLAAVEARIKEEGIKVTETILEWGGHVSKIVNTAERLDANIILIGAGEKEENQKDHLGNTAEKIIKLSSKPVLVVKPEKAFQVNTILCPVDFSGPSKRALKDAIIFARRFEARLIILTVYQPMAPNIFSFQYDWEQENVHNALRHIAQYNEFLEQFNLKDLDLIKEVRRGRPEEEILKEITDSKVDLLIMGTTGRSGLSKVLIGSVTEKVIQKIPCTFITTKTKDVIQLQLENRIRDIETHYKIGTQLMKDGFYKEALEEYKTCLQINDMHVPAIHGIVKVYEKLENQKMADKYRQLAQEVLRRIWDSKIEAEIRKYYSH